MDEIVLGMVMLASSAGVSPGWDATVAPSSAVVRRDDARPSLKLPRVLVDEPSLPAGRFDSPRNARRRRLSGDQQQQQKSLAQPSARSADSGPAA